MVDFSRGAQEEEEGQVVRAEDAPAPAEAPGPLNRGHGLGGPRVGGGRGDGQRTRCFCSPGHGVKYTPEARGLHGTPRLPSSRHGS